MSRVNICVALCLREVGLIPYYNDDIIETIIWYLSSAPPQQRTFEDNVMDVMKMGVSKRVKSFDAFLRSPNTQRMSWSEVTRVEGVIRKVDPLLSAMLLSLYGRLASYDLSSFSDYIIPEVIRKGKPTTIRILARYEFTCDRVSDRRVLYQALLESPRCIGHYSEIRHHLQMKKFVKACIIHPRPSDSRILSRLILDGAMIEMKSYLYRANKPSREIILDKLFGLCYTTPDEYYDTLCLQGMIPLSGTKSLACYHELRNWLRNIAMNFDSLRLDILSLDSDYVAGQLFTYA